MIKLNISHVNTNVVSANSAMSILDTTLCDRSLVFSGTPLSSTNKTYRHDRSDILLKAALNTITVNLSDVITL